jgi:plastocyanin
MPFSWNININPRQGTPAASFNPNPLLNVGTGDEIVWANNDDKPHWPGLKNSDGTINPTFFMPNQIALQSTSPAFSPSVSGVLNYVCSIHPDESGTIQVVDV